MPSQAPGSDSPRPKCRRRLRWRTWSTSDDLPEPETPVTQTRRPRGIATVMSLRLFSRAPCTRIRSWLSAGWLWASGVVAMLIVSPSVGRCAWSGSAGISLGLRQAGGGNLMRSSSRPIRCA